MSHLSTVSVTHANDLPNVIALVNHKLQCVIISLSRPLSLVDYALENHVKIPASINSFELRGRREPWENDSGRCATLPNYLKESERFSQQNRIVGNLVTPHGSHGQLEDDLVDALKGIRNPARRGCYQFKPCLGICDEQR